MPGSDASASAGVELVVQVRPMRRQLDQPDLCPIRGDARLRCCGQRRVRVQFSEPSVEHEPKLTAATDSPTRAGTLIHKGDRFSSTTGRFRQAPPSTGAKRPTRSPKTSHFAPANAGGRPLCASQRTGQLLRVSQRTGAVRVGVSIARAATSSALTRAALPRRPRLPGPAASTSRDVDASTLGNAGPNSRGGSATVPP